ncbi:hypothetical protein LCGC14_0376330 [marine sediment metagenome]|uniref:Uncharacterized protein n=1 Tax=marine sediment metagenome TaxID=412755 RepID=A0A0F9T3W6_9ZZZZ
MEDWNSPYVEALTKANRKLEGEVLDLRGENEKLKETSKAQGKECELRHNLLCEVYRIVDEYFSTEP